MSFVDAVREILRDAGEPLTGAEIRERIRVYHPEFYGTPSQVANYRTVSDGVVAQIHTAVGHAKDLQKDTAVRPVLISLVEALERPAAPVPTEAGRNADPEPTDGEEAAAVGPANAADRFVLRWTRCASYEDAKDHSWIIYLHEWDGRPFYWGIARTYFGGSRRVLGERQVSGRYNQGYRHWIEGCLSHGAKLYVASIAEGDASRIQEVENYLICTFGHEANRRETAVPVELDLIHVGDIPSSVADLEADAAA